MRYLATDHIHPYECPDTGAESPCGIRLYLPYNDRDAAVVICSELANNPGTSITEAAEFIAAEVISHFRLPKPPVWIEHHPVGTTAESPDAGRERFELALFTSYEPAEFVAHRRRVREIGEPVWDRRGAGGPKGVGEGLRGRKSFIVEPLKPNAARADNQYMSRRSRQSFGE